VLDRALDEAGLDRAGVYLTNAVKHFSWTPAPSEGRGKRRIHKKPRVSEVKACRPWLTAELTRIRPSVIVCLGATAVEAVIGRAVPIAEARGHVFDTPLGRAVVARHPSSVLRIAERAARQAAFDELVADLRRGVRLARRS
jgi:DNA polymerase